MFLIGYIYGSQNTLNSLSKHRGTKVSDSDIEIRGLCGNRFDLIELNPDKWEISSFNSPPTHHSVIELFDKYFTEFGFEIISKTKISEGYKHRYFSDRGNVTIIFVNKEYLQMYFEERLYLNR